MQILNMWGNTIGSLYEIKTNIIYVMISRGLKKKPTTSPPRSCNQKKKSKSKSKSKQKSKKFSPQDFLDALIDLQNTNCSTNKKKRNTTRDISSALTIATPAMQKTISASKIRSKSSFSQYRKKCQGSTKEPMTINLCAVITEQSNVQYTEKTARSHCQESENKENKLGGENANNPKKLNENICAIKIQRAWRNYRTYKMVHEMFLKQQRRRENKQKNETLHIKIRKPDLERTLKIKKQQAVKKEERKLEQFKQTRKLIEERYKEQTHGSGSMGTKSPIQDIQFHSESSQLKSQDQQMMLQKIKLRQAEMLNEVIELIEKQSKVKTKEELINKLIQKCQNNKKILERDMIEKNNINQPEIKPSFIRPNLQKQISFKKEQSEQRIEIKSVNQMPSLENSEKLITSEESDCLDYEDNADQIDQIKIFDQRLKYIKEEKFKHLEEVDDDVLESRISNSSAIQRKQRIYNKYEKEKKEVSKAKKQYLFSLVKLKKCAIKCQKSALKESLSSSKIRKSFSVGNTVIKEVFEDIKILDIENSIEELDVYHCLFKREALLGQSNQPLNTTPILELPSPKNVTEQEEQLIEKNNNTEVLKQYSEEIQELIEKQLVDEFVSSIFLEEALFAYFQPYVQEIYEFHKLSDNQIGSFIGNLQEFLPEDRLMLKRVNQKINPTSLQILRIIRDFDYETDEYELIIPEECFKKYRAKVQKHYEQYKNNELNVNQIRQKVKNSQVVQKVLQMEKDKKQKMKKYRNFERDLKIMYMKSVFNCINEFLIETKSSNAFMNARSSIGPGELTLALRQYNEDYSLADYRNLLSQAEARLVGTINSKCSIPSFKNYHDIQQFQKQVMKQIQIDSNQNQFKWVNYMDQVLEIWQDLSISIIQMLFTEACSDISNIFQ